MKIPIENLDYVDWESYKKKYIDIANHKYFGINLNCKEHYIRHGQYEDRYIIYLKYILVVLPTYNRSENIAKIINMFKNQSYFYYKLLIIDDGSTENHKQKIDELINSYKNDKNIIFMKNSINLNIANTLNKGIKYFLENDYFSHFTWISDDNNYYINFLEDLIKGNNYFKFSSFNFVNKINNSNKIIDKEYNIDSLIENFGGCASFMWTRKAIKEIGYYNTNIHGCEDYEYLIRTFVKNNFSFEKNHLMDYIRTNDSLYIKNNNQIINLKKNIIKIFKYLNNKNKNFIYYSKTKYKLLFQRPQQIMRFFDKSYNKIFIGDIDEVEYEEKYNLLVVPYKLRDCVLNFSNNDICIYYTDSRLYDEINNYNYKKIYDLIDAPIDEFEVWKPNLEKCVKNSNKVIYSHPDLVKFLNEIDNNKQYNYISNACDYEHFSKAKNRINERPNDFPQTDKPILGYYGAFSEWLDYDIIRKYADEGQYHIVMIGGIQGNTKYNMRFEHANITWLDHKSYDELPYYLSWFDKCFLPFKDCELTKYVNPCKLWEYMASGKEIIKHNVNMDVYKVVTYDNISSVIDNLLSDEFEFTLFYPETIPWNYMKQRPQHLIYNLSKKNIFIYFLDKKVKNLEYISNNLILINPKVFKYKYLNNKLKIYKKLVFYYSQASFHFYVDLYKPDFVIYDYVDNDSDEFSIWEKYMKDVIKSADIISYTAPLLGNNLISKYKFNKNICMIPNGCNPNDFNKIPNEIPDDLLDFRNKHKFIIGYYGAIATWFDEDLVYEIAKTYPIVIIGKMSGTNGYQTINIKNNPNILLLEAKPYNELYKYLYWFDCGIIPFKLTNMIQACDPCKFYEYIAMGKPVLASKMQPLERFENICYFIDKNNFKNQIDNLKNNLNNSNYKNLLIKIANENSWLSRSETMYKFIKNNLN